MNARALPALLQLASPALPIGAFSYSSGFESANVLGWVTDAASAQRWIGTQLSDTVLRWEVPLWAALFDAWKLPSTDHLIVLNDEAIAARETMELRSEQTQMGHALRRWCIDVLGTEMPTAQLCALQSIEIVSVLTVHALAAHATMLSKAEGALAYCFGFVENQVMAASKTIPLGQTDSQKMLRALTAAISPAIDSALTTPRQEWSSASPLVAIASMRHETQYTRLFRS